MSPSFSPRNDSATLAHGSQQVTRELQLPIRVRPPYRKRLTPESPWHVLPPQLCPQRAPCGLCDVPGVACGALHCPPLSSPVQTVNVPCVPTPVATSWEPMCPRATFTAFSLDGAESSGSWGEGLRAGVLRGDRWSEHLLRCLQGSGHSGRDTGDGWT